MLASINPLGERTRNRRWGATFAWYLMGSVSGGVLMGALFGAIGEVLDTLFPHADATTAVLVLVVGVVAVAFETHLGGLRLPTIVRQVDEDWIPRYRAWVYAGGFGFQLGLGVVTIVTSATVYLTWVLAALAGSFWGGILIGGVFGFVRALPLLLVARADTPGLLRASIRRFNGAAPAASHVAILTLWAVPLLAMIALGIGGGA